MILEQPAGQGHLHSVPHADDLSLSMDQVLSQQCVPAGLTVPPSHTHLYPQSQKALLRQFQKNLADGEKKWEYFI